MIVLEAVNLVDAPQEVTLLRPLVYMSPTGMRDVQFHADGSLNQDNVLIKCNSPKVSYRDVLYKFLTMFSFSKGKIAIATDYGDLPEVIFLKTVNETTGAGESMKHSSHEHTEMVCFPSIGEEIGEDTFYVCEGTFPITVYSGFKLRLKPMEKVTVKLYND